MKNKELKDQSNHPAVILGQWLKNKRMEGGFVKRQFAQDIGMSVSRYTELELGIGNWITDDLRTSIWNVLKLNNNEKMEFIHMIEDTKGSKILKMSDIFTREQLTPAFLKLTRKQTNELLDAVFSPSK